jgi:regulator of RNase E activity RraA
VHEQPLDPAILDALRRIDTPTICNALELVAPERRATGFTVEPLVCADPGLQPIVGYARTATIRALHPSGLDGAAARAKRIGYYEYLAEGGPMPTVSVIQDLDGERRGYGAFWGEVNTAIHKGLGCLGCVTDGSIRDLDQVAPGFQLLAGRVGPSHAHVHVVDFGQKVQVAGMAVASGDLVHADRHGAVVIPLGVAARIPEAAALMARREAVILTAARSPGFDFAQLREALLRSDEIH